MMDTQQMVRDPIDLHVDAQIKAFRVQNRMTQASLADALGVTFQQVQKYEKEANRMAASTLARAAAALGCMISDFYPDADGAKVTLKPAEALAELSALYGRMAPRQRDALMVTARALADLSR